MATHQFKTNINCEGCIARVRPSLDGLASVQEWSVDVSTPDKILTVKGEATAAAILETVGKAGFNIEEKKAGWKFW